MGPRGISDTNLTIGQVLVMKAGKHSQCFSCFQSPRAGTCNFDQNVESYYYI